MCTFPRRPVVAALAAAMLALAALPAGASPAQAGDPVAEARLLKQLYLIGLSRMARGDAAAAVGPFQVVTEVAPELTEAQHLLAAAPARCRSSTRPSRPSLRIRSTTSSG
jgi:hypothetical protein